jgi:NAD(P)-dependent dehydrogenase (short-subunit alcohol dehydrogenase family)
MKTVFISGATSGIGLVTTKQLAELGWTVYAAALPDDDFSVLPSSAIPLPLNIEDFHAIRAAKERIQDEVGRLDGLVNCAGIQIPRPLEFTHIHLLHQQFNVNVFGHLYVIQAMLPLLRKSESPRIVNVSSLMGKVAMPLLGAYSMSKHALEAMSDTLRMELAPDGILVSLIEMGAIATPMAETATQILEKEAAQRSPKSSYANLLKGMAKALRKQNQNAIPPELVAKAIIHALTAKKAKTRYVVDAATLGLFMMRKFAPDEIGDKILLWALGLS